MLAKVFTGALAGIDGLVVEAEVDIAYGLPSFSTVGLPEGAVRESKDRVKAAIKNNGYEFPNRRITVNLAPADLKKGGAGYDLPIALGILNAAEILKSSVLKEYLIVGELSLDGSVRAVPGTLSMAIAARDAGMKGVIVPAENVGEASVVKGLEVWGVTDLGQTVEFLRNGLPLPSPVKEDLSGISSEPLYEVDFSDVKGQDHVKRVLEIAAAGNHNVLMNGPPGSGKTMVARRLPTILPDLTFDEALEVTKIHSAAGVLGQIQGLITERPFRAPHHTISDIALIGGGQVARPGEVSFAHNGILFLDELPEFKKHVLEVLRQPLEDGFVTVSRAAYSMQFPSRFILVAAMNPCPCGYLGDQQNSCTCTAAQIQRYQSKLSGPLLDRIDLHVEVPAVPFRKMTSDKEEESSAVIKGRVMEAVGRQHERFKRRKKVLRNGQMSTRDLKQYCVLDSPSQNLVETAINTLGLSARAYHRILKIARTIADIDQQDNIGKEHVAEAIQYRRLGRKIY